MKILLAIDGSEHNKAVINNIAGRLFPPKTKLRIVSAYQTISQISALETMGVLQEYYTETDKHLLKQTQGYLDDAEKVLSKKNPTLMITKAALIGSPKNVILEDAEKFGADLIIVGSHGYGFMDRLFLGSVSHAVALHAKCSVEIVRIQNKNLSKIKLKRK